MTEAGVEALRAELDALARENHEAALIESVHDLLRRVTGSTGDDAVAAVSADQVPVWGNKLISFDETGQHPRHLRADALVYGVMVRRCFAGGGAVLPESLRPATRYVLSALPQQCADRLRAVLDEPLGVVVEPPGTSFTLWRVGAGIAVGYPSTVDAVERRAELSTIDLLRLVSGESEQPGDPALAALRLHP